MTRVHAAVLAGWIALTEGGCASRAQTAPDPAPRPQPAGLQSAPVMPPAGDESLQPGDVPTFSTPPPGTPPSGAPAGIAPTPPAAQPGADTAGPRRQGQRLIRELQDSARPPPPPAPASLPDRPGMGRPFGR